jgi:hypothetical protein
MEPNQMNKSVRGFFAVNFMVLAFTLLLAAPVALATDGNCQSAGELDFVCGLVNAEDLAQVPGTGWILASGFAPGEGIYLVDSEQKTWSKLYPADAPLARQDMEIFGACPGSPDPNTLVTHGLNLRPGENGHSRLYVTGHGGREAIEVFDVDASGERPVLTWIGCVMTPDHMEANSVAALADGSLRVTIPLHTGRTITEALIPEITGAVHAWSPGDSGFTMIQGTELPYANGIEVSEDGSEFYVASSGLFNVTAFSNTNPARVLRTTKTLEFVPDNLHMGRGGQLLTGGLVVDDPACGNVRGPEPFDLGVFASCPRPFIVASIDPQSMEVTDLVRGPANPDFSNVTMGLQVGDEIWIGTFTGDRIAVSR